MLNKVLDYHR